MTSLSLRLQWFIHWTSSPITDDPDFLPEVHPKSSKIASVAMNSYFEPTGFYGSHHHQTSNAGSHHHDQTSSLAISQAYRNFPIGLGMSPYASSQHHHHHSLHQTRPPQESPYDATVTTACKLYPSSNNTESTTPTGNNSYSPSGKDCKVEPSHQNGYTAASIKDIWQSATSTGATANSTVRSSDSRGYTNAAGMVATGDPSSSPNGTVTGRTSWGNNCINSSGSVSSQPAAVGTQLHQQSGNHTFYPWMAIAGKTSVACCTLFIIYFWFIADSI